MYSMTEAQAAVLDYIEEYLSEHEGVAPTFSEIQKHFGYSSKSIVHRHLMALEERGAIRRYGHRARAIEIVHKKCPHCGEEIEW